MPTASPFQGFYIALLFVFAAVIFVACQSEADKIIEQAVELEEEGNPEEAYDLVRNALTEAAWDTFSEEEERELRRLKEHLDRQFHRPFKLDLDATVEDLNEHQIVEEGGGGSYEETDLDEWRPQGSEIDEHVDLPDNIEIQFDESMEVPEDVRRQLEVLEVELERKTE